MTAELQLRAQFGKLTTRDQGAHALEQVAALLLTHDHVVISFGGAPATPSFVDELIGGLSDNLREDGFARRVSLSELDPSVEPLVRHVLLHRRAKREKTPSAA